MGKRTEDLILTGQGSNIVSNSTVDLASATGNYVIVTGTTTITSFGTVQAGAIYFLEFQGALTINYNATSMIIPGSENLGTGAGDVLMVLSLGSGNWRVVGVFKRGTVPLVANDSEVAAATATGRYISPSNAQKHPSAAKAWGKFSGEGTAAIDDDYNIASITDNGTGDYTFTIDVDMASADYAVVAMGKRDSTPGPVIQWIHTLAAGSVRIAYGTDGAPSSAEDVNEGTFVIFGDQ